MLFNSSVYIFLFLPIVVILYFYLIKQRFILMSKTLLVFASIFFYNWWNPKYTPILLFSILFNYAIGSSLNNLNFKTKIHRKSILLFGVFVNLAVLGYFKYMDFFISNLNVVFHTNLPLFNILLPLGISFFTFQQITYLVDSYSNETKEYDFLNYTLFVSFFPQLIAGPIVHHKEMMPQFQNLKTKVLNHKNIILGIFIFIIGFFKKVVFADTYSMYVNTGLNLESLSIIEAWITSLSYTLQIYFDFSGYCDMAIGSALLFNIKLPVNFNSPYKSQSIQEFWTRWHMTLSKFLRDYVYIPLGGNRSNIFHLPGNGCNILITFFASGLWHGANWTFVLWGVLHGCCVYINHLQKKINLFFPKWVNVLITFFTVNFLWILFRANNFAQAKQVMWAMFDFSNVVIPKTYNLSLRVGHNISYDNVILFLPIGLLIVLFSINSLEILSKIKLNTRKAAFCYGILFAVLFLIALLKMYCVPYSEFIYFNF